MYINKHKTLTTIFLVFISMPVFAEGEACLINGSFKFMGPTIEINDCYQRNGIPKPDFIATCKSASEMPEDFGGEPAKVTYMKECPAKAVSVCEQFGGSKMAIYYYSRANQASTMADLKQTCSVGGGKWSNR